MRSLPLFHQITGQPVIVLGTGEAAQAKARLVERAGGIVVDDIAQGIDQGARLAFIAHDSSEAAEADAIRLRCAGLLVNVADRPDLCDFILPSVLDRDPVLVAVGTGGASAGLAKALRLRLEGLLPQGLGALAEKLGIVRQAMKARWPAAGDRRRALDAALAHGGPLDPLTDATPADVERWLERTGDPDEAGAVTITIASDDPEDLTLRQARLLGSADTVCFEPGIAPAILDRARADSVRIPTTGEARLGPGLTVIMRRL